MSTISLEMTWKGAFDGLSPEPNQITVCTPDQTTVLFQATVNHSQNPQEPQLLNMNMEGIECQKISLMFWPTTKLVIKVAEGHFFVTFKPKPTFNYRLELERKGCSLSGSCKPLQYIELRNRFADAIAVLDDRDVEQKTIGDCCRRFAQSDAVISYFRELGEMGVETLKYLANVCLEKDGVSRKRNLIGALMVSPLFSLSLKLEQLEFLKKINLAYNNQQLLHSEHSLVMRKSQEALEQRCHQVNEELCASLQELWKLDVD